MYAIVSYIGNNETYLIQSNEFEPSKMTFIYGYDTYNNCVEKRKTLTF